MLRSVLDWFDTFLVSGQAVFLSAIDWESVRELFCSGTLSL
jgi:hypothetical protein